MNLKRIPNLQDIGEYSLIVDDFSQRNTRSLDQTLLDSPEITRVYIVAENGQNFHYNREGVETRIVSQKELDHETSNLQIPNWVRNHSNLQHIIRGEYSAIKPVTAEFVPTLNCNYRCVQCSYSEPKKNQEVWLAETSEEEIRFLGNNSPEIHMAREVMETSLDRLSEGGVRNILFTGGGEPFRNRHTIGGMEHAKAKGSVVALYSNGRLLNQRLIERVIDLDPLFVRISIYGGNQETVARYTRAHNDIHSFARVIENVSRLAERKRENGSTFNLGLSYLLHPITMEAQSIGDFADTILRIEDVGQIDYIRFTPAVDYFHGQQHSQESMETAFEFVEDTVMSRFSGTGVKIIPYHHRLKDLNQKKSYDTCRGSGWYGEVGPSGEVFLCCEKHFMPDFKIGDLKTQTLDEIWAGDLRAEVLDKVNSANCSMCPTLCKPHELNKIFDKVETARDRGQIELVDMWTQDLIRYGKEIGFSPGKLDDFQS